MNELLNLPFCGILISIAAYSIGVIVCNKYRFAFINPLLISIIITLCVIIFTPISAAHYQKGGNIITLFILPATVVFAINVYRQRYVMLANLVPLLAGCAAGSCASIISIKFLSKLLKIEETLVNSMLPKSVTTAIALELSAQHGGIPAVTIAAVTITGISISLAGPAFVSRLHLKDRIAAGCAMGMSGHAIGTARALALGSIEGGMAGISLCFAGIVTSVLFLFLP
jgi:putative effector of murein hydrolase